MWADYDFPGGGVNMCGDGVGGFGGSVKWEREGFEEAAPAVVVR